MADFNINNNKMIQDHVFLPLLLVIISFFNLCSCQPDSPRNIETFYPLPFPTPPVPPALPNAPLPPHFPPRSSRKAVITAIAATAASAFVLAALIFLLFTAFSNKRRRDGKVEGRSGRPPLPAPGSRSDIKRGDDSVKGLAVEEDGLDVLYWKKLSDDIPRGRSPTCHSELPSGDRSGSVSSEPVADEQPAVASVAVPKAAPPPPPGPVKIVEMPPPPPASKPAAPAPRPPPPGGRKAREAEAGGGRGSEQVKLKALHWEKVNISHERSNVWDEIEKGSFQYNGDMMEALFGVAVTKKAKPADNPRGNAGEASARIFILDQRKSQNISIVIKSLGVSLEEVTKSLVRGGSSSLGVEILEKLSRMAPTKEEASEILAFSGDETKLAGAELFLRGLLKAVPWAFTRADQMLFTFTYQHERLSLTELLRAMESACRELRAQGVFLKLLEAILKAGNRLNAGTARGNARGFSLTTLRKLSDYKTSDGKSTLLHFVVHQVVRKEGTRCALMRATNAAAADPTKEDRDNEYLRLGLPAVAGLSSEFSDVRKAATIDYDALKTALASLANRVKQQATELGANPDSVDQGDPFLREMTQFLASAEAEMQAMQQEHDRVMELVSKTTHYYQAKASNDRNPLQLFVIVKDFLGMVDLACVEIARTLQQQKKQTKPDPEPGSASNSGALKNRMNFPQLPNNFMSDKSSSSSEDES